MILSALDSPIDLYAAVSASRLLLRVMCIAPERTFSSVIRNAVHPEAIRHALANLNADVPALSFDNAE